MAMQVAVTVFLFLVLSKDKIQRASKTPITIRFEVAPSFYLVLLIIGSITLWYNYHAFNQFPELVPSEGSGALDYEMSFISSLKYGINSPRSNILAFSDPLLLNQHLTNNPLPLLYEAAICTIGASFRTASTAISFINAIAATAAIYYLGSNFSSNPGFIALVFMLNGSWCLFKFFSDDDMRGDLIHGHGRTAHTPWDSLIGVCLSFNKEHSFSIPMALFALAIAQCPVVGKAKNSYIIAALLAVFVPNFITSLSVYLACTCYELANPFFIIFGFIPFFRYLSSDIKYNPLWREYQMCDTFLPSLTIWVDSFGPSSVTFILMWFFIRDSLLIQRFISTLGAFLILQIFRQGNDYANNACAVISVFFPMVSVLFVEIGEKIKSLVNGKMTKGAVSGIVASIFVVYMISGFLSLHRLANTKDTALEMPDLDIGRKIQDITRPRDTILSDTFKFNPAAAVAGRQIVSGSFREAWRRGCDVFKQVELIREVRKESGGLDVMRSQDIRYLLDYKNDEILWDAKHYQNVYENEKWVIYQLHDT